MANSFLMTNATDAREYTSQLGEIQIPCVDEVGSVYRAQNKKNNNNR